MGAEVCGVAPRPASERRANLTKWLPRGLGEASAAAFLARKVAALDHAVARTPDGRSVVWLDVDCVLVKKPDGTFLGFLKTVDVATIARVPVRRERPETGVVALTGGAAALIDAQRRHGRVLARRVDARGASIAPREAAMLVRRMCMTLIRARAQDARGLTRGRRSDGTTRAISSSRRPRQYAREQPEPLCRRQRCDGSFFDLKPYNPYSPISNEI